MFRCIYSGADESSATFSDREHIFPKCIGGVRCLPRGYVSDEVNHQVFSGIEQGFARENPLVVIPRMFSPPMGRKKHTNRERIGVMRDADQGSGFSLGVVRNGKPFSLDQLIVTTELLEEIPRGFPIHIRLAPSKSLSHEQAVHRFWEKLTSYAGSPTCIKSDVLPPHTYLLGVQDKRWFLALPKKENPEHIKPRLAKLVAGVAGMRPEQFFPSDGSALKTDQHHVEGSFTYSFSLIDHYRVCAKIAINCLAELKGQECAMDPALDGIKKAILTGERMEDYAWFTEGENPGLAPFKRAPLQFKVGENAHCAAFVQTPDGMLVAMVSVFGTNGMTMIHLGRFDRHIDIDCYICDWENNRDYTMLEAVRKVCGYDEDNWHEPPSDLCL